MPLSSSVVSILYEDNDTAGTRVERRLETKCVIWWVNKSKLVMSCGCSELAVVVYHEAWRRG